MSDKKILCIGLVCLDIINVVDKYPEEDTDSRCQSQRWQRGGNASNSCTVLSLLGAPCAFMGSLAPGPVADFVLDDFQKYSIDVSLLSEHAQCSFPASVVISNVTSGSRTILHMNSYIVSDFTERGVDISGVAWQQQGETPCACCVVCPASGSRTVVLSDTSGGGPPRIMENVVLISHRGSNVGQVAHCRELADRGRQRVTVILTDRDKVNLDIVFYGIDTTSKKIPSKNLPDATAGDFSKVDLSQYKWIHWEGRNAGEQVKMIQQVELYNSTLLQQHKITVSVEIEKTREPLYQLFCHGDVVFVSKDVAMHFGFSSADAALRGLYSRVKKGAVLICAWAEKGADAMGPDHVVVHSDAFPPKALVDTLGAGDTFNAAVIFTLSKGGSIQEALTFGCQVAGSKCGVHGYDGIVVKQHDK